MGWWGNPSEVLMSSGYSWVAAQSGAVYVPSAVLCGCVRKWNNEKQSEQNFTFFYRKCILHTNFSESSALINPLSDYSKTSKLQQFTKSTLRYGGVRYVYIWDDYFHELFLSLVTSSLSLAAGLNCWHRNALLGCDGAFGEYLGYRML